MKNSSKEKSNKVGKAEKSGKSRPLDWKFASKKIFKERSSSDLEKEKKDKKKVLIFSKQFNKIKTLDKSSKRSSSSKQEHNWT